MVHTRVKHMFQSQPKAPGSFSVTTIFRFSLMDENKVLNLSTLSKATTLVSPKEEDRTGNMRLVDRTIRQKISNTVVTASR